jgi:predicted TIM-barrel fold metal-dependent hydrolase
MSTRESDMRAQEGGILTDDMSPEEVEGLQLMMVRQRDLGYKVFDADNHLYEGSQDALTKFLPEGYKDLIRYAELSVDGRIRTRILVDDHLAGFIPNPTFVRVIPPGGASHDPNQRRSIQGAAPFFDPEPRLRLMDEFGIDRCLLFATLAGTVEPYLINNPTAIPVFVHAFNQWLHEHWSYAYEDRIFGCPMVSLAILSEAIKELEYVLDHGARTIWVRPTPHQGLNGPRSFALPEFDPFWKLVEEADVLVNMHTSLWRVDRPTDVWEGGDPGKMRVVHAAVDSTTAAFMLLASPEPTLADALASIIGHGVATRFPKLKFAPIEFRINPVLGEFVERIQRAYEEAPAVFDEDPYEVLKRNVFIHNFQDKSPAKTIEMMGIDNVMFGSDFPHPEGLNDPLSYADLLVDLPLEDQAKVMGGNMARLLNLPA